MNETQQNPQQMIQTLQNQLTMTKARAFDAQTAAENLQQQLQQQSQMSATLVDWLRQNMSEDQCAKASQELPFLGNLLAKPEPAQLEPSTGVELQQNVVETPNA